MFSQNESIIIDSLFKDLGIRKKSIYGFSTRLIECVFHVIWTTLQITYQIVIAFTNTDYVTIISSH